ncbi:aminoacyl-tRNA hydrolase [Mycoplasma crocodyli]|uniref:Peptidyl-tRNA hydrolase n=1 Tax=Mycoplasma crocodyli (strain ATCC 51981 / MP145) TaxID=512564 RepID=D5E6H9_MYCCM|nr:aminoacyl-tRNA hydrolase [Mycoplasma crocodyli]ADE19435.1 aminoacyl-tRNA hydrolase [Mycoplasma crocodyli MP145]
MRLIVGLGNPGDTYKFTRHNAGFMVIDIILKKLGLELNKNKFNGLFVKIDDLIIAKPMTYMNLSGTFVKELANFYKILPEDILVIYDEKDYDIGNASIKVAGGVGSHNGVKNISENLDSVTFKKMRIGIGRGYGATRVKDHVLGNFTAGEMEKLEPVLNLAADAAISYAYNDINTVMNQFNIFRRINAKE